MAFPARKTRELSSAATSLPAAGTKCHTTDPRHQEQPTAGLRGEQESHLGGHRYVDRPSAAWPSELNAIDEKLLSEVIRSARGVGERDAIHDDIVPSRRAVS